MSEYGYIPEAPEQSAFNNKGIFKPKDIYNLDQADKWTPQLGQLELIETQTASNVNYVDFTNLQESTYNVHFVTVTKVQATGTSTDAKVQLIENGVVNTSADYQYAYQEQDLGTGTVSEVRNSNSIHIGIDYDYDPQTARNNYFYLYNAGDSSKYTFATWHYAGVNNGGFVYKFGSGVLENASTVDGFRIYSGTVNNIDIDAVSIYGIKEYS
jgi:hypothetical protein